MKRSYVYIITNRYRTVFYIGVTANLFQRIKAHKEGTGSKFCRKYNVSILVYYEVFSDIREANKLVLTTGQALDPFSGASPGELTLVIP
jgi:predicted GIY-YIG superfamily endonuclease